MGGEIAAETMTRKKKKGRPSLLELQKRSLKQQHQQQEQQQSHSKQNPNSSINSNRRSTRRNPSLDGGSPVAEWITGGDDDEDERQQKKHKLLLGLNSSRNHQHYPIPLAPNSASNGSDSNADGEDPEASHKRRKAISLRPGSDQMEEKVSKATDTLHGSPAESGPTTPLPDKKLLVFILDRLQKKDTYGVFSEPVDPEELPDYHDIIAHPMDFQTVRRKLDGGAYTTLEQFEKDVFLICSNAMEYNAPDTIYFRQARSMQELAKKDFENLRQDSDEGEPQPKVVRRGRPPGSGKSLKKSLESSSFDRVGSEFSSDVTLATGPNASCFSNTYNLRKAPASSHKLRSVDTSVKPSWGLNSNENYASWSSDWENEFPASVVKAVMKYGKKHFSVDENKRDTYNPSSTYGNEQPIFSTLDGELKQLIPVGLSAENGYATSLARFAADLGPIVWKIASKKIESVLPSGSKFGPGWVGESRITEQPQFLFSEKQKSSNSPSDHHFSRLSSPPGTSSSNTIAGSRFPLQCREDLGTVRGQSSQNDFTPLYGKVGEIISAHQIQQRSLLHSGINGSFGRFGIGYSAQLGSVAQSTSTLSERMSLPTQTYGMVSGSNSSTWPLPASDFLSKEAKFADGSNALISGNTMTVGHDLVPHAVNDVVHLRKSYNKQDLLPFPPDLNLRFLAPGSPSSSVPIGSPQHPDLALQL